MNLELEIYDIYLDTKISYSKTKVSNFINNYF
jgi:hypothetical protein